MKNLKLIDIDICPFCGDHFDYSNNESNIVILSYECGLKLTESLDKKEIFIKAECQSINNYT